MHIAATIHAVLKEFLRQALLTIFILHMIQICLLEKCIVGGSNLTHIALFMIQLNFFQSRWVSQWALAIRKEKFHNYQQSPIMSCASSHQAKWKT